MIAETFVAFNRFFLPFFLTPDMNILLMPWTLINAHCSRRHQPRRKYVSTSHATPESVCVVSGTTDTKNSQQQAYTAIVTIAASLEVLFACGIDKTSTHLYRFDSSMPCCLLAAHPRDHRRM